MESGHFGAKKVSVRDVTIVLLCALLLVSCSTTTQSPSPSPGEQDPSQSVYGRLFAQVGADGSVSKDVALQAFSTAIAPLPGVPEAEGGPPPEFQRQDGTFAINWILPYLDQLTPEQRGVVDQMLSPSPQAVVVSHPRRIAAIGLGGDPEPAAADPATQPYTDAIATAEGIIASRLRRDLNAHINFDFAPTPPPKRPDVGPALAFASPGGLIGPSAYCAIRATPELEGASQSIINVTMAHEVFHCFQFEVMPNHGRSDFLDWIVEGQAEWAGEDVAGPSPLGTGWWGSYLKSPGTSLFGRTYDAVGFYEHLVEQQISPWDIFDQMLATPTDSTTAFKAAGAASDGFLDTWASGLFRSSDMTPAWLARGRWNTNAQADIVIGHVANGDQLDLSVGDVANVDRIVGSSADVTEVNFTGHVRMYTGGTDTPEVGVVYLCTNVNSQCKCPIGYSYNGPPLMISSGLLRLALTGGLSGASGYVRGRPISDFCDPAPSTNPIKGAPRGGPSPCAKGCAASEGEPHLSTVGGQQYDFQAAGEYELLRSADGSIDMQVRQIPLPGSDTVAIDAAVAWLVNGHRVSLYGNPSDTGYTLHVDGSAVPTSETIDLGAGAQVTPLISGVEVAWPDGTLAWAYTNGTQDYGINLTIAYSPALKLAATGLLAPIANGSEFPPLADGEILPLSADHATRYDQVFNKFAPSWHVTDQTSLFDYDPGQSTQTFDVANFPATDVPMSLNELQIGQSVDKVSAATDACAKTSKDQNQLQHCLFDVLATANPGWADIYQSVETFLEQGPSTPGGNPAPAGMAVVHDVDSISGSALLPDGSLVAALANHEGAVQIESINPATGSVARSVTFQGTQLVGLAADSLWVATGGVGSCGVDRLHPGTLANQASISVPCTSFGAQLSTTQSSAWIVDDSGLHRIDPTTNTVESTAIPLPVSGGRLQTCGDAIFNASFDTPAEWYRLGSTDSSFVDIGQTPGLSSPVCGASALWSQDNTGAERTEGSGGPDATVAIGSDILVAADDKAVYAARESGDAHSELWRYPIDGSASTLVAQNDVSLPAALGSTVLRYQDARILTSGTNLVALWPVSPGVGQPGDLYVQAVSVP